jgi:hypothetical protein
VAYLARVEAEATALARSGPFATSPAGLEARAAIDAARARVAGAASRPLREALEAERDELVDDFDQAVRMEKDIAAAERIASQAPTSPAPPDDRRAGGAHVPFVMPFRRYLPSDVRRYGTFLFWSVQSSRCGR